MTVRQHGPHMQSFNIEDGDYPDVTPLPVRTGSVDPTRVAMPDDPDVTHEEQDFPVRWLRERSPGHEGMPLAAGVLLMKPCVLDFTFVGDETILLVSGAIDVTDDDGHLAELRGGDMAYFAAGTRTTWTVVEPAVELFTILG